MDIVKKDIVLQETTVVATVVVTATTEATARGTRVIGNEAVAVAGDGVVTEMVIDIATVEEGTTMIRVVDPQDMTTSVDETTAAVMMNSVRPEEVKETTVHHVVTVAAAKERVEMVWVRLNEGPQRLKARHR